jgi:hypothetical protein
MRFSSWFRRLLVLLPILLLSACTGRTLGENAPGGAVLLDYGSIAVDTLNDNTFVLGRLATRGGIFGKTEDHILAIDPDTGLVRDVANTTFYDDVRLIFPNTGILIMGEVNGKDELRLLDHNTFQELDAVQTNSRYNGVRLSPSLQYMAVADNTGVTPEIHIIDTETLNIYALPHNGDAVEAMWLNGSDTLAAIIFYDVGSAAPYARVIEWSISTLINRNFPVDSRGLWAESLSETILEGAEPDLLFSYTWIGVSPDDRYTVYPVRHRTRLSTSIYRCYIIDNVAGTTQAIDHARGPVGFTPDGSTIISYDYLGPGDTQPVVLAIDPLTGLTDEIVVPLDGGIHFFVSHDENIVVLADPLGGQSLVLYDVDNDLMAQMPGPRPSLNEFVSRPGAGELWIVDQGLFRLDFLTPAIESVELGWTPNHINRLPNRDLLVMNDRSESRIVFFDPVTYQTTMSVFLPTYAP